MNVLLMIGSFVVTLALIAYSIGIITEQRTHKIGPTVMRFVTIGIILDIIATTFMIVGSPNSPFTYHGFLGYSALGVMLIDVILIWRLKLKEGIDAEVPKGLHFYSRYAYAWWVIAFITGGLMVIIA